MLGVRKNANCSAVHTNSNISKTCCRSLHGEKAQTHITLFLHNLLGNNTFSSQIAWQIKKKKKWYDQFMTLTLWASISKSLCAASTPLGLNFLSICSAVHICVAAGVIGRWMVDWWCPIRQGRTALSVPLPCLAALDCGTMSVDYVVRQYIIYAVYKSTHAVYM